MVYVKFVKNGGSRITSIVGKKSTVYLSLLMLTYATFSLRLKINGKLRPS